jgi:hypothetical protein
MSNLTADRPASEKQLAFFDRLVAERDLNPAQNLAAELVRAEGSMKSVSGLIDYLLALPKKPATHDDGAPVSEGYYFAEGLIYKVQAAKASGNLYAKVFSESGYEYAPGAMRLIPTAARLTLEQAAEAGVKTGRCVVCSRLLTDPESVAAGIGPVCAVRL